MAGSSSTMAMRRPMRRSTIADGRAPAACRQGFARIARRLALAPPGAAAARGRPMAAPTLISEGNGMRYRHAMDNALDVMTFLAYSAGLGLLVGVLLGMFALLLAAPAQAAAPAVGPMAGSLLLHRASGDEASPALLLSTETVFRSEGPIQRVRVVQAFRNPFRERQEGVYVLRLPEESTLERLMVRVQQPDADAADGDAEESEEVEPDAAPSHAL